VYQQFDRDAVCSLLGVTPADTPAGLILHGVYDMPEHAQIWRDRLANARVAGKAFNVVIGEYRGATVWYVPVLGAPLAAFATHCAAVMGVRGMIQIGSFGGTQKGWEVGELLLASGAERGDAASDWYLPPGTLAEPTGPLNEQVRTALRARGVPWREGTVFTTPAFMAEKWEDILRWEAAGHSGVEMELATTFAVAAHFGVPSAGLIYLLDNLIAERHLLHNTEEDHQRIAESRRLIEEVALEVVAAL
jgi:uridine phosphorylase